jgi:DNA polymerase III delta prime subunit
MHARSTYTPHLHLRAFHTLPVLVPHPVIETHTKNVRFCILCNYVNKITPAIQSRCTRFRFSPLPESEVQRKVDQVVEKEG